MMAGMNRARERPRTAPLPITSSTYTITDNGNTSMKVVVRIRPESEAETRNGGTMVVRVMDTHLLVFDPQPENVPSMSSPLRPLNPFKRRVPSLGRKAKDLRFAFDRVFDENSTQREVFEESTKNIVESVLDGVNCSVFAYGATGAGKTYTMLGAAGTPGVIFHTMMELYHCILKLKDEKVFEVAVSYCEVYNESIRDLLSQSLDGGSLELREDAKNGLIVSNLSRHQPKTAEELLGMLERGNLNRTQHPTDANATSSRSHAVFQVYVRQRQRTAAILSQFTSAKLSLIDLAGSERATVTTNRGARFREGANINKSLLALGNCINALAENKTKSVHIPYRNSKLTRLLKDSLGGNCRTVMIANISPSSLSYEDTYNTLKYADRAKQIKTKAVRNVVNVEFHISRYRVIVQELQQEIAELKEKLEDTKPAPLKDSSDESRRLQDLVRGVYGERLKLRKLMVDLDTQERETLLRVCRKERDWHRIDTLTGNQAKKAKLEVKVSELQKQIVDIERQKQMIHEYLFSNNEAVSRIQSEVKSTTAESTELQDLMREVVQCRKLETENAHHWRQTKHLLRYVKAQEREIGKTERILLLALEVARKQHSLLRAHNALTPSVRELFHNLAHAAEGEKGVAWADLNASVTVTGGRDVPDATTTVAVNGTVQQHCGLSDTQKALFDTFLVHASPARRLSLEKHSPATFQKPVTGILTKTDSNASSNGSATSTISSAATDASQTSVGCDSGVGCDRRTFVTRGVHRSNSDASSATSSLLSSRLSTIPDKPRMPTPIDDLSSSCSSNNSVYDTRLNTVINSYHHAAATPSAQQPPATPYSTGGLYRKLSTSRGCTPTSSPHPTPRGTPEPYLTPLPSLHKLTLTRQNSDRFRTKALETSENDLSSRPFSPYAPLPSSQAPRISTTPSSSFSPSLSVLSNNNMTSARVVDSVHGRRRERVIATTSQSNSASAFSQIWNNNNPSLFPSANHHMQVPPHPPPPSSLSSHSSVYQSTSYRELIASATRLQNAPFPPPHASRTPPKSLPPAPPYSTLSFSSPGTKFEDNFVPNSSSSSRLAFQVQALPAKGVSPYPALASSLRENGGHVEPPSLGGGGKKDEVAVSEKESSFSSHSSSSTVKSVEPSRHFVSRTPVVTVETHSTVVSLHPSPPSPLPHSPAITSSTSSHHSVNIGLSHTHQSGPSSREQLPTTTERSRPPAFVPPPTFSQSSIQNQSSTTHPSLQQQTCTLSTKIKCTSTSTTGYSTAPKIHQASHGTRGEGGAGGGGGGGGKERDGSGGKRRMKKKRKREEDSEKSSPLNSTFTVQSNQKKFTTSSSFSFSSSSSGGGRRREGRSNSGVSAGGEVGGGGIRGVPGALKMLYVNSPSALNERGRKPTTESGKSTAKVPNYLQLTKAAASKRVAKTTLNKENGTVTTVKGAGSQTRGAFRGLTALQPTRC